MGKRKYILLSSTEIYNTLKSYARPCFSSSNRMRKYLQRMNFRGKFNEMNGKKDAIYQCISHYNHNGSDTKIKKYSQRKPMNILIIKLYSRFEEPKLKVY